MAIAITNQAAVTTYANVSGLFMDSSLLLPKINKLSHQSIKNKVQFKISTDGECVEWNFGDGTNPYFGKKVKHWYKKEGAYLVSATSIGKYGIKNTQWLMVKIAADSHG